MQNNLDISIDATHEILRQRLERAVAGTAAAPGSRDRYPLIDNFLASASRHLGAASAVLIPEARRRLPDGDLRAHAFVHQCRLLEQALSQTKARLYGQAYAIHRPWSAIWADVAQELRAMLELERALVDDLIDHLDSDALDALASKVYRVELHSPTRPHPYLPHVGLRGRLARQLFARADSFWDAAEGRMIPEPVRPHHHKDGRMSQYLLADPHFPDEDNAVE